MHEIRKQSGAVCRFSEYRDVFVFENEGQSNERITNLFSNSNIGNANSRQTADNNNRGPVRCGVFAGSHTDQGRTEAGASYYGIMELSGNEPETLAVSYRYKAVDVNRGRTSGRGIRGVRTHNSAKRYGYITDPLDNRNKRKNETKLGYSSAISSPLVFIQ